MTMKMRCLSAALLLAFVLAGGMARAGQEQKVTLVMSEFKFMPATVTLQARVPARITLVNKGAVEHELMIYRTPKKGMAGMHMHEWAEEKSYFRGQALRVEGPGVEVERMGNDIVMISVAPGKSAEVRFTPKETGTYEMGCHVAGHYEAGMKGTFVVVK